MRAERPIVSSPDRQTLTQRLTSGSLKTIAWGLWIYLWLPVLSAVAWFLGFRIGYRNIIRAPNQSSLIVILVLVFVCNLIVSSWASYNYIRFYDKKRRQGSKTVTHEAVGSFFGVHDPETLAMLLTERRINLYFNAEAGLDHAEALIMKDAPKATDALTPAEKVEPIHPA